MEFLTVAIAFVVGTLYIFYKNRKIQTNVFRSMGIPGPEPHWLTGNLSTLNERNSFELYEEWEEKYGRTFGYYEGPRPILVTSDPDFIKEVYVKQFSKFHGRKPFTMAPDPDTFPDTNMMLARGHRWKRLRSIINPTFSTQKLRQVAPLVQKKVDVVLKKFSEAAEGQREIDISDHSSKMSVDVIGETAFGMEIDAQTNPDEPFLKVSKEIAKMGKTSKRPLLFRLAVMVPEIEPLLAAVVHRLMTWLRIGPWMWLQGAVGDVIEQRKQQTKPRMDLLQLMLDAESTEDEVTNANMWEMKAEDTEATQVSSTEHSKQTVTKNQRKLTNLEIGSNSTLLLLAGGETTGTLLSFLCYELAVNPEKQAKLLEEVDKYKDEKAEDAAPKMTYLDMCVRETLRLYPIGAPQVNRLCMEDSSVCGVDIKKDMVVQANVMALHHNPDFWGPVDTKSFHPERFSPENSAGRHDLAWIPFGAGPRNCVGMRFALMETKHAIITLLRKLTFKPSAQNPIPLKLVEGIGISPVDNIMLKVVMRE